MESQEDTHSMPLGNCCLAGRSIVGRTGRRRAKSTAAGTRQTWLQIDMSVYCLCRVCVSTCWTASRPTSLTVSISLWLSWEDKQDTKGSWLASHATQRPCLLPLWKWGGHFSLTPESRYVSRFEHSQWSH